MRLLNTTSFELVWCINKIPEYAILSHTWGDEEVTFKDLVSETGREKKGWSKIKKACQYAASHGWEYIWIDTCCIDKSDPTELGEAINSMFRWYESAAVCYAYLADVPCGASLERSRWFTRGWTLQELLAPRVLEFIDSEWNPMGSREDWATEIERATGIKHEHLTDFRQCCLATKLSWAADRQTTRTEDHAYSLLGLLGVHMPLIYGEGEKAFVRLQQELLRKYNDESILVWHDETPRVPHWPPAISEYFFVRRLESTRPPSDIPILAQSPKNFKYASSLETHRFDGDRLGFEMTNAGLSMNARLFENHKLLRNTTVYLIELNCTLERPSCGTRSPMVLILRRETKTNVFLKVGHPPLDRKSMDSMPGAWKDIGRCNIVILEGAESLPFYSSDEDAPKYIEYQIDDVGTSTAYRLCDFRMATQYFGNNREWNIHRLGGPPGSPKWITMLPGPDACICKMIDPNDNSEFLVVVKWGLRAVVCGIWPGSFEDGDIELKLNSDPKNPFPVKARGQKGNSEVRILVLAQAHKNVGRYFRIAFRRRTVDVLDREAIEEVNDPRII